MGRMQKFLEMVRQSKLLAPNLKEMTIKYYTGNQHKGNSVAREVVRDHLLALRWMNPNAVIYLHEIRGQGTPVIEYELWTGGKKDMEIKGALDSEEVIAKVMMAARDPADDDAVASKLGLTPLSPNAAASEASSSSRPADSAPSSSSSNSSSSSSSSSSAPLMPPSSGVGAAAPAGVRAFSTYAASSAEARMVEQASSDNNSASSSAADSRIGALSAADALR